MAGTARVNPRSAPILPSPNLSRDGSFANPAMAIGALPPIEPPRALQDQRRQRQQQQQRGPLKRGRGFRDDAGERERAARERADRMVMMEREHMMMMMMMPHPPHIRIPPGRSIVDPNPAPIRTMYGPPGPGAPVESGRTMYSHTVDGPAGHANDIGHSMYGYTIDGAPHRRTTDGGHMMYSHTMDGPRSIYSHPGHPFDASGHVTDGGHSIYNHLNHPIDGGTIEAGNGRTFAGPSNMDGRRNLASIGNHGHKATIFPALGSSHRINGPLFNNSSSGVLHMEVSSPHFDFKGDSDFGTSSGIDNTADIALENSSVIEKRSDFPSERLFSRSESQADRGLRTSRTSSTKSEGRERNLESSVVAERKSENYVGMENSLDTSGSLDRRSETVIGMEVRETKGETKAGRPEMKVGQARRTERAGSEGTRPSAAGAPGVESRIDSSSQRSVESKSEIERTLDRRVEALASEYDEKSGSRPVFVQPTSFGKGRLVELEHQDSETNRERSREDERQMDDIGMQELVAQYKMALAELTFNSKPIITNLTIIAGENVHASRLITSTICAHILEVPVEQKLPSLYLLDSIVKNIGNDYVKHFSAKLPEVFIKSYREVDTSMHPAMQHLFKTWRVVFNMDLLKEIEAKLQINVIGPATAARTAPSSSSTRADNSSSQQSSQSIHVNPKYLEAQRQKTHQASQSTMNRVGTSDHENGGARTEDRESFHDKDWGVREEGSSRGPFRSGSRNEFELPKPSPEALVDGYGNIRGMRSSKLLPASVEPIQALDSRIDRGVARNWQNIEQGEDSGWEGSNSRLIDVNPPSNDLSKNLKGEWFPQDDHHPGNLSGGKPSGLNQPISEFSGWHKHGPSAPMPSSETPLFGLNEHASYPFPRQVTTLSESTFRSAQASQNTLIGFGKSNFHAQDLVSLPSPKLESSSPVPYVPGFKQVQKPLSLNSPLLPIPSPPEASPVDQPDFPSSHPTEVAGHQVKVQGIEAHFLPPQEPPSILRPFLQQPTSIHSSMPQNFMHADSRIQQPANEIVSDQQHLQAAPQIPAHLLESLQSLQHHLPPFLGGQPKSSSLPSQPQETGGETLNGTMPLQAPPTSMSFSVNKSLESSFRESRDDTCLQSGMGILPATVQAQPPLPTGPPPLLNALTSSNIFQGQSVSLASSALTSTVPFISLPVYASLQPPLPPGPPPLSSQVASSSLQLPPMAGPSLMFGNNYNSLLSSLMAQGIISATAAVGVAPTNQGIQNVNAVSTTSTSVLGTLEPAPSASMDNSSVEFKQEALRSRDDSVIVALYSVFSWQCTICGLRFKHQEEHSKHMDWHTSRNQHHGNLQKVPRSWFMNLNDWLNGKESAASVVLPVIFPEEVELKQEEQEEVQAVPADESQVACFLCGEPFEDFFSEETEEWMYKGAVYMKVSLDGSLATSSQGPIVHAKCQSEAAVSKVRGDVELFDEDYPDERKKRLRF